MAKVHVTVRGRADLEAIGDRIAGDNLMRAVSFLAEIDEKAHLYARNPDMGADRSDLHAGLRSFPHGNYMVYYRRHPGGIQIVRVLHGRRSVSVVSFEPDLP